MEFIAKVLDPKNRQVTLRDNKDSQEEFIKELQRKNYRIISVRRLGPAFSFALPRAGINKANFFSELYDLISSGLTLEKGLTLMAKHTARPEFYEKIVSNMREGKTFSQAAREQNFLSSSEIALLSTGEEAGEFREVLRVLADYTKRMSSLKSRIQSMLYYPLFLLAMVTFVFFYIFVFVIPKIMPVFDSLDIEKPAMMSMALRSSEFITANPVLFVILLGGAGFLIYFLIKKFKGEFVDLLIKVPVVGKLLKHHYLFMFLHPFSLMLKKGIYIKNLLKSLAEAFKEEPVIIDLLTQMQENTSKGQTLSQAISASTLFNERQKELVKIAEESSTFQATIEQISQKNSEEYENSLKSLISIIEPTIILLIGLIILGFVLNFILPIMNLDMGV